MGLGRGAISGAVGGQRHESWLVAFEGLRVVVRHEMSADFRGQVGQPEQTSRGTFFFHDT